jgi:FtsP/CotA-like multicopper oxidase with cupredoxin domain
MLRLILTILVINIAIAKDYSATGAALEEPTKLESSNGVLTHSLSIGYSTFTLPTTTINTRAYDNSLPGPAFYINQGDTMKITMVNNMAA